MEIKKKTSDFSTPVLIIGVFLIRQISLEPILSQPAMLVLEISTGHASIKIQHNWPDPLESRLFLGLYHMPTISIVHYLRILIGEPPLPSSLKTFAPNSEMNDLRNRPGILTSHEHG